MSWLGYKTSKPTVSEADIREARRIKLEQDRLARKKQREQRQKALDNAVKAREEADQALRELHEIAPDIFDYTATEDDEVSTDILENSAEKIEMDFDEENGDDVATAMDNLRSVQCPFNKEDIVFWFSQLEDQLTLIGVKKQWA